MSHEIPESVPENVRRLVSECLGPYANHVARQLALQVVEQAKRADNAAAKKPRTEAWPTEAERDLCAASAHARWGGTLGHTCIPCALYNLMEAREKIAALTSELAEAKNTPYGMMVSLKEKAESELSTLRGELERAREYAEDMKRAGAGGVGLMMKAQNERDEALARESALRKEVEASKAVVEAARKAVADYGLNNCAHGHSSLIYELEDALAALSKAQEDSK